MKEPKTQSSLTQTHDPPTLPPPGFTLFPSLNLPQKTLTFHQISTLFITFIAYAAFHASRKPPSIVKSVLGPDPDPNPNSPVSGWAPFNSARGPHRLGELDLAFLSAYAIGMYLSGHVGDRIDLRVFLTIGMVGSGVFTVLFGLGFWFDVHILGYFVMVQICCGVFQSIGWPCVVAVMGNWFGKSKRGLIMGMWNSHTSVGNIVGSIVASSVLGLGWGWAFVLPGVLIVIVSVVVYLFLVVNPETIGLALPGEDEEEETGMGVGNEGMALVNLQKVEPEDNDDDIESVSRYSSAAIGFLEAWKLPGVAPYAFCLFFSKLVAYTFLYWLPFYIRHTAVAGVHLSHKTAGILSTIFDIGGVVGGILAGYISDLIEARAVTSIIFLTLSVPALIFYRLYGSISMFSNVSLMFFSGLLVNGPYALITTAVAADLGTQSVIKGSTEWFDAATGLESDGADDFYSTHDDIASQSSSVSATVTPRVSDHVTGSSFSTTDSLAKPTEVPPANGSFGIQNNCLPCLTCNTSTEINSKSSCSSAKKRSSRFSFKWREGQSNLSICKAHDCYTLSFHRAIVPGGGIMGGPRNMLKQAIFCTGSNGLDLIRLTINTS